MTNICYLACSVASLNHSVTEIIFKEGKALITELQLYFSNAKVRKRKILVKYNYALSGQIF